MLRGMLLGLSALAVSMNSTAAWAGQGCAGSSANPPARQRARRAQPAVLQGFTLKMHKDTVLVGEPVFALVSLKQTVKLAPKKPTSEEIWARVNGTKPHAREVFRGPMGGWSSAGNSPLSFAIHPRTDRWPWVDWVTWPKAPTAHRSATSGCPLAARTAAAGTGPGCSRSNGAGCKKGSLKRGTKAGIASAADGCADGACDPALCPVGCNKPGAVAVALSDRFAFRRPGEYTLTAFLRVQDHRLASNSVKIKVVMPRREADKAAHQRLRNIRWAKFARGQGDDTQALEIAQRWPDSTYAPYAEYYRGRYLEAKGNFPGALAAYQTVTERYADSFIAKHAGLASARCEIKMNKFQAARQQLDHLLKDPSATYLYRMARSSLAQIEQLNAKPSVGPQARAAE